MYLAFVCSVTSYSYSLNKQLSEELGLSYMPIETVRPASAMTGEVIDGDRCCRQNSSLGSLSDLNHSPSAMYNRTAASIGSTRRNGHVQKCNITEQNDALKLSDASVASSSHLYVFTYLTTFKV